MSDNMSLVEHVRRNKNGLTKMQIQIPISMRAGMAELSRRFGVSQLAIVRSALAAYLLANNAGAPAPAPAPTPEVTPVVAPEEPEDTVVASVDEVIAEAQPEETTEAQPE